MDPLSVGSAVVGLIAGASRIVPILYHFITHTHDAPKTASQILDEMHSITAALEQLQTYLNGAITSNVARRSMLSLRNIVATLTACVTTYSDLEIVVRKCTAEDGKVKKVKWVINETDIVELVQRVQSHKSSLTLMLTILQCESMQEAETSMARLVNMVEGLVISNANLQSRMDGLVAEHESIPHWPTERDEMYESLSKSTFQSDLDMSRVYRKLRSQTSRWSLDTDEQVSMALTAFSDLTMDDVSNLSVFRLPIWSRELSNPSDFGTAVERDDAAARTSPVMVPVKLMDSGISVDHHRQSLLLGSRPGAVPIRISSPFMSTCAAWSQGVSGPLAYVMIASNGEMVPPLSSRLVAAGSADDFEKDNQLERLPRSLVTAGKFLAVRQPCDLAGRRENGQIRTEALQFYR